MSRSVGLINASTYLTDTDLNQICSAMNNPQYIEKFCADWSLPPVTFNCIFKDPSFGQPPTKNRVPGSSHSWRSPQSNRAHTTTPVNVKIPNIFIYDSPDAPNIVASTDEPHGRVFVKPLLDNNCSVLGTGKICVASVIAQEALQLLHDRLSNKWIRAGQQYVASEVCDPVAFNTIPIVSPSVTVYLADWILPEWQDLTSRAGPYNRTATLDVPCKLADAGLCIVNKGPALTFSWSESTPDWFKQYKIASFRVSKRASVSNMPIVA
jgi:hypothetical protein